MQSPLADALSSALPPTPRAPTPVREENAELLASVDDFGRQRERTMRELRRLDEQIAEHSAYQVPPANWSPEEWSGVRQEIEACRNAAGGELRYLRPSCVPPPNPKENMERLLALLVPFDGYGLVVGDILRRLGRFDEAIATYKADETIPAHWSGLLCGLAANEHSELVELPVH